MDTEDEKALRAIMQLVQQPSARIWEIEQAIRHALTDAFLRGAKHGMDMSR